MPRRTVDVVRDGELRTLCVETIHTPHDHREDVTAAELRESAYRRGVQQGIQFVIDILEKGGTVDDVKDYILEIHKWRYREGEYKRKRDFVQHPPRSGRKKR